MRPSLTKDDDELRLGFSLLQTLDDVADILEIDPKTLIYHLYRIKDSSKYVHKKIKKRNGEFRDIYAPATCIKIIQKKLNHILNVVYGKRAPAHGFVRERNILTNAKNHVRKKYILNFDISNFFPSINFGRVRGMFMGKPYYLGKQAATVLSQICIHGNHLPQGAPTSPTLSNMICARMDSELRDLASRYQCYYTRYADDMSISTYKNTFPKDLAYIDESGETCLGEDLVRIISGNGFKVNLRKTRLQSKYRRQEVTGIIVNEFANVRRSFIRQIRAMLHAWDKYGLVAASNEFHEKWDKKDRPDFKEPVKFEEVLLGKMAFLAMIRGKSGDKSGFYQKFANQYEWLRLRDYYASLYDFSDRQKRGYIMQQVFNKMFRLSSLPVESSFTRNDNGEQIDGAFRFAENRFIVEIRWRSKQSNIGELDGLLGKVHRSGLKTMGLFVSISGWSNKVVPLLKQNPSKCILLMNDTDIKALLNRRITLSKLLQKKMDALHYKGEPYIPLFDGADLSNKSDSRKIDLEET